MIIQRPGFMPLLVFDLDKSFGQVPNEMKKVESGVGVFGSAAAYALVWELGTTSINPGPKTRWSTNRYGQRVVMTKQAPHGYVGINEKQALKIIKEEIGKVNFNLADLNKAKMKLEIAMDNAAVRIARLISDDAPVDSGDLRSQIQLISSDELDLLDSNEDEGTLFL